MASVDRRVRGLVTRTQRNSAWVLGRATNGTMQSTTYPEAVREPISPSRVALTVFRGLDGLGSLGGIGQHRSEVDQLVRQREMVVARPFGPRPTISQERRPVAKATDEGRLTIDRDERDGPALVVVRDETDDTRQTVDRERLAEIVRQSAEEIVSGHGSQSSTFAGTRRSSRLRRADLRSGPWRWPSTRTVVSTFLYSWQRDGQLWDVGPHEVFDEALPRTVDVGGIVGEMGRESLGCRVHLRLERSIGALVVVRVEQVRQFGEVFVERNL